MKTKHLIAWILLLVLTLSACQQQNTTQKQMPAQVTPAVIETVPEASESDNDTDDHDHDSAEESRSILDMQIEDDVVYLLFDDKSLWAWAPHFSEEAADSSTLESTQMKPFVHVLDQVKRLVRHGAIRSDDTLWLWSPDQFEPTHFLSDIKDYKDNLLIKTDASLWAFGSRYFSLGDGVEGAIDNPETVPPENAVKIMDGVRHIVSGGMYSTVITEDDHLMRWGTPMSNEEADYFFSQNAVGHFSAIRPVHTLSDVRHAVFSSLQSEPSLIVQLTNGLVIQSGGVRQLIAHPEDVPVNRQFPSFIPPVMDRIRDVKTTGMTTLYLLQEDGRLMVSPGIDPSVEPLPVTIEMDRLFTDYYEIDQDVVMFAASQDMLLVLKNDGRLYAAGTAPFDPQEPYAYNLSESLAPAFLSVSLSGYKDPDVIDPGEEPDQTDSGLHLSRQSDFYDLTYWYDDVMDGFGLELLDVGIFALVFMLDNREIAVPVVGPFHPGMPDTIYNTGFEPEDYSNRPLYLYDVFSGIPILEDTSDQPYHQSLQLTPFLSGDFEFIEVYSLNSLFKHYFHLNIDMSNVESVRDLRLLYERYVPSERWLMVDDNIRFLSDKTFVETFQTVSTAENKIRFVNSFSKTWEDDVFANDDRIYKMKEDSVYDLITGQYIGMTRYIDGGQSYRSYNTLQRKIPAQMIPFFDYFPDLQGTTIISVSELEQLYHQRIPQKNQIELDVFEPQPTE